MQRSAIPAVLFVSLLVGARSAHAQDTAKVAAAESLFEEAEKLETAGNLEQACGKYAESQQLDPGLGTLLHLAQCYEKAGKTASAWGRYREAFELAVRAGDQRSEIARKRADKLEPMLSKLTISVKPQNQVTGLAVARDGVAVGAPQWNLALPMDPGPHVIVASAAGYEPFETKIVTPTTAAAQSVEIPRLAPLAGAASTGADGKTQRLVGLGLAGTGAAALLVGGILGITAKLTYDKSNDECRTQGGELPDLCSQPGLDQRSSGRAQGTASTVLVIGGAALAGAGAVLFFTAPSGRSKTARGGSPQLGFGPAGFVVRGRF